MGRPYIKAGKGKMMKTKLSLILGGMFLLCQAGTVWASTAFTVSATVPLATGISIVVDSVNATGTPVFTQISGAALSFDAGAGMTLNTNNIYTPSVYYALNITTTGGAGVPDTTVTYAEGANPNGTSSTQLGLGNKSVITFTGEPGELSTTYGKKRLIDLVSPVHVPYTYLNSLGASYLRLYVGVWTGSTTAPADPANGQPFSNADAPGQYTGTLTVTSVVN
jgi:hypothetical protein